MTLKFEKEKHAYTFSGRMPWMNRKTDASKRSFETALMMVYPDAIKLKYIATRINIVETVCFLSLQRSMSATETCSSSKQRVNQHFK